MISIKEATNADEFHYAGQCSLKIGKRGRRILHFEAWRRSGRTRLWAKEPYRFILPVKRGLYTSHHITEGEAKDWHTSANCDVLKHLKANPESTIEVTN